MNQCSTNGKPTTTNGHIVLDDRFVSAMVRHKRPTVDMAQRLKNLDVLFSQIVPIPQEWHDYAKQLKAKREQQPQQQPQDGNTLINLISLAPPTLGPDAYHGFIGRFIK